MQRVTETMGKEQEERRNSLYTMNRRGDLGKNKSSFHNCGIKEPLRGYLCYLDENILPLGNNNDNTPLSFVCLNPGFSEIPKRLVIQP